MRKQLLGLLQLGVPVEKIQPDENVKDNRWIYDVTSHTLFAPEPVARDAQLLWPHARVVACDTVYDRGIPRPRSVN